MFDYFIIGILLLPLTHFHSLSDNGISKNLKNSNQTFGRTEAHALFPDYYDYDYGYGEYRGGYSDPYYDDYYGYEDDYYGGGGYGGGYGASPRGRGARGGPPSVGDFPLHCINETSLGESVLAYKKHTPKSVPPMCTKF